VKQKTNKKQATHCAVYPENSRCRPLGIGTRQARNGFIKDVK
jgi:hypothetical protein